MVRIHRHLNLKITAEELELRRAHQGETCSTTEVQDHLERLRSSKTPRIEDFRVEWMPQALNDLETIWRATNPPPPPNRQHAADIKLVKNAVNDIDRRLRAWAILSTNRGEEGHVLVNESLAVLFRVFPERFVVLVEYVQLSR